MVRTILVRRTGRALGDQIYITPSLRALRLQHPDAVIDLMCTAPGRIVLRNNVHIRSFVIPYFPGKQYPPTADGYDHFFCNYQVATHLREHVSIVKHVYAEICEGFGLPTDDLRPEYYDTPDEREAAKARMRAAGLDLNSGRPIVLLHTTASIPMKSLPDAFVARLAERLLDDGIQVGYIGREMPAGLQAFPVAGRIAQVGDAIRISFAMLRFANVLVCVDSCFSHVAAAMGTPTVALYGPSDAALYCGIFPNVLALQAEVPCGPCSLVTGRCPRYGEGFPPCMRSFDPDDVFERVRGLLDGTWTRWYRPPVPPPISPGATTCPFCDSPGRWLSIQIKRVYYYRCRACQSLYAAGPRAEEAGLSAGKPMKLSPEAVPALAAAVERAATEFACPRRVIEIEPDDHAVSELLHRNGWTAEACPVSSIGRQASPQDDNGQAGVLLFVNSFELLNDPIPQFRHELLKRLLPGGVVLILGILPSRRWSLWPQGWLPVFTPAAGTHRVFASRQGIRILARRLGLRLVAEEHWRGSECVFWVLQKP